MMIDGIRIATTTTTTVAVNHHRPDVRGRHQGGLAEVLAAAEACKGAGSEAGDACVDGGSGSGGGGGHAGGPDGNGGGAGGGESHPEPGVSMTTIPRNLRRCRPSTGGA
jgi:hypothetical protein